MERRLEETTFKLALPDTKFPKLYAFDILAFNEESVCHLQLNERREMLQDMIGDNSLIKLAERYKLPNTDSPAELHKAIDQVQEKAVKAGCEGIIVKIASSKYLTSGVRVNEWIKLKHTALGGGGIKDTLDLVPIGAFYGKGNRTGKLGSFLMGAYNRDTNKFESICKVGTGFKFADLETFSNKLTLLDQNPTESELMARKNYKVASSIKPDVWLKPTEVWEI